jgi:hypothetical protein
MQITTEWLDDKFEEIKKMQEEIDKRIEQLSQQKLMNFGAIAMINELKKEAKLQEEESPQF